jgi:hypothetical protein
MKALIMVRKKLFLLALVTVFASCSETDNYEAPNGGIYGQLIDKITNEPLQTQQPNGFTVQLFEKGGSANVPILIPGKPDGSYENAFIFQNEYAVLPTEGAFFPMEKTLVQVGKSTESNFEVMPFLALTQVNVTPAAGKITATYKIARSQVGGKIMERRTLVSDIPTVNTVVFKSQARTDLSATVDEDILAGDYTDEVTGLTSGKTYYVRIAVRTANALGKFNYSKPFRVTIP